MAFEAASPRTLLRGYSQLETAPSSDCPEEVLMSRESSRPMDEKPILESSRRSASMACIAVFCTLALFAIAGLLAVHILASWSKGSVNDMVSLHVVGEGEVCSRTAAAALAENNEPRVARQGGFLDFTLIEKRDMSGRKARLVRQFEPDSGRRLLQSPRDAAQAAVQRIAAIHGTAEQQAAAASTAASSAAKRLGLSVKVQKEQAIAAARATLADVQRRIASAKHDYKHYKSDDNEHEHHEFAQCEAGFECKGYAGSHLGTCHAINAEAFTPSPLDPSTAAVDTPQTLAPTPTPPDASAHPATDAGSTTASARATASLDTITSAEAVLTASPSIAPATTKATSTTPSVGSAVNAVAASA